MKTRALTRGSGWFAASVLIAVVWSGCASEGRRSLGTAGWAEVVAEIGGGGPLDGGIEDVPLVDGQVCHPGEAGGCTADDSGLLVCLADGSGFGVEPCETAEGKPGRCLDGACTPCVPGGRLCRNDDEVWQCDDTGANMVLYQDCNGPATGQVCTNGACVRLCDLAAKWDSYMGCDYWGADLDNAYVDNGKVYDAQGKPFAIVVSNPHPTYPAEVTIYRWDEASGQEQVVPGEPFDEEDTGESDPAKSFPTEPIPPGGLRIFRLPRRDVNGTVQAPLAYHVRASIPVTAYQFNPLENEEVYSNDASLLLPSNVLGTYYWVMTREQSFAYLRGYLAVVAANPGATEVSITVTAPTLVGDVAHLEPGDSITRTLHQYDVLAIETDAIGADLTGSLVYASKPVAVFGGSEASNAPNTNHCAPSGVCEWDMETPCEGNADCSSFNTCCADHLEQQLFPVETWGRHYLCAKSFDRGMEKDVWRVIASEPGTQVTTLPVQVDIPVLNAGEWVDFESDEHFELVATKPVMVGQFLAAERAPGPGKQDGDAGIGDPAFILVVPEEQFRQETVFLAPDKYELDYVTVVARHATNVAFDGAPIDPGEWEDMGSGEVKVARFAVTDGVHRVDSSQPVGVYVYGYDSFVSYGYPAGLDLKPINQDPEARP